LVWTAGTISRSLEPGVSLHERFDLFLGDDKRALAIAEPLQQNFGRLGELRLRAFQFLELSLLQTKRIFELALAVVGRVGDGVRLRNTLPRALAASAVSLRHSASAAASAASRYSTLVRASASTRSFSVAARDSRAFSLVAVSSFFCTRSRATRSSLC
jgi:hypothetical protein